MPIGRRVVASLVIYVKCSHCIRKRLVLMPRGKRHDEMADRARSRHRKEDDLKARSEMLEQRHHHGHKWPSISSCLMAFSWQCIMPAKAATRRAAGMYSDFSSESEIKLLSLA